MFKDTLNSLFRKKKVQRDIIEEGKKISTLSDSANKAVDNLISYEYEILKKNPQDYYISFIDLLELIQGDMKVENLVSKCKHYTEITSNITSAVEVYAIPSTEGILLTTTPPENYKGDKVKVVTIKRVKK